MYTWGDYNDPDLVGALADSTLGVTMKVDYYASNEDLITKLASSNGNSGFDIVVPTGPYVPQMIEKGLIQKLDMSLIPNFANLDPSYTSQAWDPNNEYSVCKNWGTTATKRRRNQHIYKFYKLINFDIGRLYYFLPFACFIGGNLSKFL